MAVWFHDAIYDPRAQDNEQKSAELFVRLADGDFEPAFAREVNELILVTRHDKPPDTKAEKLVVDVDLSSFGLPWEDFTRDSDAVRQEYAHLPDHRFHRYQVRFMSSLLARPSLYGTGYFREHYEVAARSNIRRYLASLASLGYTICADESGPVDNLGGS
jgi:predicted metal-dependent HD superfamily phosphohydrolase